MSDHRSTDRGVQAGASGGTAVAGAWLIVLRRYVFAMGLGNLVWEFAQLPLYTVWEEGSAGKIAFAALHCTGGDVLIASLALLAALLVLANVRWPHARYRTVATAAVVGGLGYTIYSEWLNTEIRGGWAYRHWMPQLPLIGTGVSYLSPLARWLVVPPLAFWWARRPFRSVHNQTGVGRSSELVREATTEFGMRSGERP
jgi:hypothetical protein